MVTVLTGAGKTNNGLELLDEVEFVFHRTLKQFSGAINRQHGMMELTNGHVESMHLQQSGHEIHRMVCKAYPGNHTRAAKVKDIIACKLSHCPVRYLLEEAPSHLEAPCILEDAYNGVLPEELFNQAWSSQSCFNGRF
jgi:hypothetical protein